MLGRIGLVALAALALAACDNEAAPLRIIGSSTVFPFTTAVAAAFVDAKKGPAPVIESIGTVAGFERFCANSGSDSPDIADASRRITRAEFRKCQAKGVGDILEIAIGLDGLALAESSAGPKLSLSRKDLYLALAAFPLGKPNTAKLWKDVNPLLPAIPIKVFGPPPSSGTRDVFEQMLLEPGCMAAMPEAKALLDASDPAMLDRTCRKIRSDGAYIEVGEKDELIVKGIEENPNALGVFGYSYLEQNAGRLRGVPIDGSAPDAGTIGSGKYPGVRTLYLYAKARHVEAKPGLQAFLNLYATMWAPGGPLTKRGLIAMSESARKRSLDTIQRGVPLDELPLS